MVKYVIAALLGMTLYVQSATADTVSDTMAEACELSGYSCQGVLPPILRFEDEVLGRPTVQASYFEGVMTLRSDIDLESFEGRATLVHELVHHLQHNAMSKYEEIVKYLPYSRCQREAEAWAVENYWKALNFPKYEATGASVSFQWFRAYPHCDGR